MLALAAVQYESAHYIVTECFFIWCRLQYGMSMIVWIALDTSCIEDVHCLH